MTPLVSVGERTAQATVAGNAEVTIDGRPVNQLPVVPVLLGAMGVVILVVLVEAVIKWGAKRP